MDIIDLLQAHHEELRALLHRLGDTDRTQPAARRDLAATLLGELTRHEQLEDEIFYPAAAHLNALVAPAHAEHRVIDDQLATLLRVDPSGNRFAVELATLTAALSHHAGKEESDMFPEVAAKLDQQSLDELGRRAQARLDRLRASRLTGLRLTAKYELLRRL